MASVSDFWTTWIEGGVLEWTSTMCTILFLAANADKVIMAILAAVINDGVRPAAKQSRDDFLRRIGDSKSVPQSVHQGSSTPHFDEISSSSGWQRPLLAVQVPLFNEVAVTRRIIQHACALRWPRDRLIIQILDDSTKRECRDDVDEEVALQQAAGVNVVTVRRANRRGFKAGALNDATKLLPSDTEYVVLFDADFTPTPDFLDATLPYLESDRRLAFVQAKWSFVNGSDSLLNLVQLVNLNYHHNVEQTVRSYFGWFSNFCGKFEWSVHADCECLTMAKFSVLIRFMTMAMYTGSAQVPLA